MNLSNVIADLILQMLSDEGIAEIQRNEMAERVGCVPSQINYVISSRFTPEYGYIVESRRGGGGYIKIQRANYDPNLVYMQVINAIGNSIDEKTSRAHIHNLNYQNLVSDEAAKIMLSAVSDNALKPVAIEHRDIVRASVFKQLLLSVM